MNGRDIVLINCIVGTCDVKEHGFRLTLEQLFAVERQHEKPFDSAVKEREVNQPALFEIVEMLICRLCCGTEQEK